MPLTWGQAAPEAMYNSMFSLCAAGALPTGGSKDDPSGHTSACPGWTAWQIGGGKLSYVSDNTWPGGGYVQFSFAGTGTGNTVNLTSDLFITNPGQLVENPYMSADNAVAGCIVQHNILVDWYARDGKTIVQTDTFASFAVTGAATFAMRYRFSGAQNRAPLGARFGRLTMSTYEDPAGGHDPSNYFRLGQASVVMGVDYGALPFAINVYSFPVNPAASSNLCFRLDLGHWYYYNGTTWVQA